MSGAAEAEFTAARRGRPGHDLDAVLRAAVELFNRHGYDATSMDDLARVLGVGKSAIYHHVSGKADLLTRALNVALDGLEQAVDEAVESDPVTSGSPAYDRLERSVRGSVRVLSAHLPEVTLLLRVRGNSDVELAALERRRTIDDRVTTLVAEAVVEGSLRNDVAPDVVSRLLFGMVNSVVEWWRPVGPVDGDALADAVVALAFGGLRAG